MFIVWLIIVFLCSRSVWITSQHFSVRSHLAAESTTSSTALASPRLRCSRSFPLFLTAALSVSSMENLFWSLCTTVSISTLLMWLAFLLITVLGHLCSCLKDSMLKKLWRNVFYILGTLGLKIPLCPFLPCMRCTWTTHLYKYTSFILTRSSVPRSIQPFQPGKTLKRKFGKYASGGSGKMECLRTQIPNMLFCSIFLIDLDQNPFFRKSFENPWTNGKCMWTTQTICAPQLCRSVQSQIQVRPPGSTRAKEVENSHRILFLVKKENLRFVRSNPMLRISLGPRWLS